MDSEKGIRTNRTLPSETKLTDHEKITYRRSSNWRRMFHPQYCEPILSCPGIWLYSSRRCKVSFQKLYHKYTFLNTHISRTLFSRYLCLTSVSWARIVSVKTTLISKCLPSTVEEEEQERIYFLHPDTVLMFCRWQIPKPLYAPSDSRRSRKGGMTARKTYEFRYGKQRWAPTVSLGRAKWQPVPMMSRT